MPGPRLNMMLMQPFADVGGVDAWLAGNWDEDSQWWTGWHLHWRACPNGLPDWSWPSGGWTLIGHERWEWFKTSPQMRLMEAFTNHPNPSTTAWDSTADLTPEGHWHVVYNRQGHDVSSAWLPNPLTEPEHLYLKGSGGKGQGEPKGKGKGNGVPDGQGQPKGKGKHRKGTGKGDPNGQGKGEQGEKSKVKRQAKGDKGKTKGDKGKPKDQAKGDKGKVKEKGMVKGYPKGQAKGDKGKDKGNDDVKS